MKGSGGLEGAGARGEALREGEAAHSWRGGELAEVDRGVYSIIVGREGG